MKNIIKASMFVGALYCSYKIGQFVEEVKIKILDEDYKEVTKHKMLDTLNDIFFPEQKPLTRDRYGNKVYSYEDVRARYQRV